MKVGMRVWLICGWFLIHFLVESQAQVSQYAAMTPDKRVIELWRESFAWPKDTTKTLRRLDSIGVLAQKLSDDRLYWYTELHKIWYRSNSYFVGNKANDLLAGRSIIESCPVDVVRASYYFLCGQDYFSNKRDFDNAFRMLFRARNMLSKIGYDHVPEAIYYLNNLAHNYYWFEDYKTTIQYIKLAEKYPNDILIPQLFYQNTAGMAYQRLKAYKQAEQKFKLVIDLATKQNNPTWVGIGSGNYGNTLRIQGKSREALPYLYQDVAQNEKYVPDNSALTCLYIAKALLALDSTTKAGEYLNRATQLYRGEVFSNYRLNYYEALTTYYRKTGNYPKVTQYLDSTVVLKDSLKAVFSNKALLLAESSLNAERYLTDLARINTEKNNAIWQRNLIIGSLILLGLAGFYLIEQRRQREKMVQNEKQKRAEEQLSHAKAQLNQYLANLREKNELIDRISLELEAAKQDTTINAIQQQQMMSLLDSVILTDKAWVSFRQLFEQVHPRFFETLQANYPDLTPAEIRLLTLQKLNITTKDMAFMLGVSAESIRKSRYRLRKKLGSSTAMTELVNLQDT